MGAIDCREFSGMERLPAEWVESAPPEDGYHIDVELEDGRVGVAFYDAVSWRWQGPLGPEARFDDRIIRWRQRAWRAVSGPPIVGGSIDIGRGTGIYISNCTFTSAADAAQGGKG